MLLAMKVTNLVAMFCTSPKIPESFIAFLDELGGPSWTKSGTTMVVVVVPCVTPLGDWPETSIMFSTSL